MKRIWLVAWIYLSLAAGMPVLAGKVRTTPHEGRASLLCDTFLQYAQRDTAKAFQAVDRLPALLTILGNDVTKARALRCLGQSAELRSNQVQALERFSQAQEVLKNLAGKEAEVEQANLWMSKGLVYQKNGDLENAFKLYLQAEKNFDRHRVYDKLLDLYPKIGDIYLRNQLDTAKNRFYIQKAEKILPFIKDQNQVAHFHIDQSNVLFYAGREDEAFALVQQAIQVLEKQQPPNYYLLGTAYYNMGYYLNQQDKPTEGEVWYRRALKAYEKSGIRYDITDATIRIGSSLYYQKRYGEAISYLLKGLAMADSIHSKILIRNAYDVLSYAEADRGNYRKAYEYLDAYVTYHLEMLSEKEQSTMSFLHARNEDEKKMRQITDLKLHNRIIWMGSALALVLLVLLLVVQLYRQRLLKNQHKLAEEQVTKLEQEKKLIATQAVLEGENAERTRLARDLHDGLGGMLSVVKLHLFDAKKQLNDEARKLDDVLGMIDRSMDELRRVAHNMMPETLHQYGLKVALSDFCGNIGYARFHYFGQDKRLDPNLEIMVYRTAMELVNNALKYAQAQQINVQVVLQDDLLTLTVQDDGTGFDPNESGAKEGQGLSNIRNRAAASGGTVDILTAPGQGCEIVVTFNC